MAKTYDHRIEHAAQADAEGGVQKGRGKSECCRNHTEQWGAEREPGDPGDREYQTDQLGELQRRNGSRSVTGPSRGATTVAKTRP